MKPLETAEDWRALAHYWRTGVEEEFAEYDRREQELKELKAE